MAGMPAVPVSSCWLALYGVAAIALITLSSIVYNLFFHPLRSYPGPWYAKASIVWFFYRTILGNYTHAVHQLHLKYGAVVRIAPNELAYTDPQAWKDIYGHRNGIPENAKDPSQIISEDPAHPTIIDATREHHSKIRRLISNGFSDKSMRQQENVLASYVKLFIEGLRKNSPGPVDLVEWYNLTGKFTTFDIIGHLAFAESFDCLTSSKYHPWVSMIFSTLNFVTWLRALNRLAPVASPMLMRFIPKRMREEHEANFEMSKQKLLRRKAAKPEYTDLMTHFLQAEEKGLLVEKDLVNNAQVFVVAGSETTATLLSGATYYILQDPRVYKTLVDEIRLAFRSPSDITLTAVSDLKYLLAVLDEALRLYPPAASNHPRVTPPQGAMIVGRFVPPKTVVGINQYAMFRSPLNFHDPDAFVPERALPTNEWKWANDRRDALQPFSYGPRNCVGRNLAYAEMRLIMAHLLLSFDLELMPGQEAWLNQRIMTSWVKKPLMVKLHPIS
ncbi:hypothetical protein S40288_03084 [Stachybotrys chartarum IBT 40288]|nr:hypothetical protein S40288_03084 [Stachybotrys chartarum IBT 40288]